MKTGDLKIFDCLVGALLIIGGLNWGLVGFFDFNLVAMILGEMSVLSRIVYALVGMAAVYDIITIKAIWKRWEIHFKTPAHV